MPWLVVLLCCALSGTAPAAAHGVLRIAVLPFEDSSGYQGVWDLAHDVPRELARHLRSVPEFEVLPADSAFSAMRAAHHEKDARQRALRAGRALGADLVVCGRIEACGARRTTAGDPNLASYKSYSFRVDLQDVELIRVGQGQVWRTLAATQDTVLRPLEMNLFGKPGELDRQYQALFEVAFGSPAFLELAFGQFADGVLQELAGDVAATVTDRPPLKVSREGAEVLVVEPESGEVFLGIGSDDGAIVGDTISLVREGERVAAVRVIDVIGAHLSKAKILESTTTVAAGDRIGQRLPPRAAGD